MAVKASALSRQPNNFDFARPTQFRFDILRVPNTTYFVQEVNLPGIAFSGDAIMNSRFKSLPFMGDTLNYNPLELNFVVQENLTNYLEIHNWMTGIGFPADTQEYIDGIAEGSTTKPLPVSNGGKLANPQSMTSDATLTVMTNKNNPKVRITFKNIYPTSLGDLNFDTKDTDATQFTVSATFNYDIYSIEVL